MKVALGHSFTLFRPLSVKETTFLCFPGESQRVSLVRIYPRNPLEWRGKNCWAPHTGQMPSNFVISFVEALSVIFTQTASKTHVKHGVAEFFLDWGFQIAHVHCAMKIETKTVCIPSCCICTFSFDRNPTSTVGRQELLRDFSELCLLMCFLKL